MATVAELLLQARNQLEATSPTARLDADLLLGHVLAKPRHWLLAERDAPVSPVDAEAFLALVARRANLEPVAYLLGSRGFYGLDLLVDQRVLVPRPETELLVELALARARQRQGPLTIADIGTGSGAIALALATHLPNAHVIAVEIDAGAQAVAAANIARLNLGARVELRAGDLLAPLAGEQLDLLVSNPPYTLLAEIDEGVRRHEPHLALDGGPDGLAYYRRLAAGAAALLKPGGSLLFEIGAWQAADVSAMLGAALPRAAISVHQDLAGLDRVVVADC